MKNFNFFEKLWEHSRTLRRVGLVLVMCLITITQAWAVNAAMTKGETLFIIADGNGAWDASACVKACFSTSDDGDGDTKSNPQTTTWLWDGSWDSSSGKKCFYTIVPTNNTYKSVRLYRYASNCTTEWNWNGGWAKQSKRSKDNYNCLYSSGSGTSNFGWKNAEYSLNLFGETNSWGSAIGKLVDCGNGVFKYSFKHKATQASYQFKIQDSQSQWHGSNVTLSSLTNGRTYIITATVDLKSGIGSLAMSAEADHTPGVYETAVGSGGYGQTLKTVSSRDYEVYHFASSASNENFVCAGTTTTTASDAHCMLKFATTTECAKGWIANYVNGRGSSFSNLSASGTEFNGMGSSGAYTMNYRSNSKLTIIISGYDQFSMWGKDNSASNKFQVYIDGSNVTTGTSTTASVRRYDINTGRHEIEITAVNSSNCEMWGFSLRLPEAVCGATAPGTISKGSLSGCSLPLTADGDPASNNTWYWQSAEDGTDKTGTSGATKNVTSAGTYYVRSFYSTGSCWSDARSVTVTAADLTPAAPSALAKSSETAKGVTLTVTDSYNTNDYEFYVSTSSTDPVAGTAATHSSNTKSITITNLYAGTTFYAWARAKCGSNKSAWTALTGSTFTTSTVSAAYHLTNVSKTSGAESGIGGSTFSAVFSANTDYSMPTPTVTIGGNAATSGTDYTWTAGTGTISIPAAKITGNIVITLNSVPSAPSSATISGAYHYFPGDNISLTCTPSGNNGPTTYQWYKGGKADGNAIDGATSATYTKNSCAFDDAGSYYCKVTCNATSIWANSGSSYDVKILRLYVNGSKSGDPYGNVDFVKVSSTTATASISLGSNWTYGFNIADGCGHYYGNSGTMKENNCTNWVTNVNGTDCGLTTTNAATYIFTINYSNLSSITTTVTYPTSNQASGKVIYFDNNVLKWTGSSIYYRIGHNNHSQADQLSLVPGTANLYKMTTREYNGFSAWQIGNAEGGNGSSKSIYNTQNTPAITASIAYEGGAVTADAVTVTPGSDHSTGGDAQNNNCEFYSKTITTGMKTDQVTITAPTNGTITVSYTNTSNSAANFTSGYADLAHTCIITPTATPSTGYKLSGLTVNASAHTSGSTYTVTGATTVAATFAAKQSAITFDKNGGTGGAAGTTGTYGSAMTTVTVPTRLGYTFDGYYDAETENNGSGTKYYNANGTSARTWDIDTESATTLYAKWVEVECPEAGSGETVYKFVPVTSSSDNVASSSGAELTTSDYLSALVNGHVYAYGSSASNVTMTSSGVKVASSTGYLKLDFDCALIAGDQIKWKSDQNSINLCNTTSYNSSNDLTLAKSNSSYSTVEITSAMVGKQTLYLVYNTGVATMIYFEIIRPEGYSVTYKANGGTGSDVVRIHATAASLATVGFTRAGYDFTGWKTGESSGTDYAVGDVITEAVTLYAQWSCVTPSFGTNLSTTQVDYEQNATASALTVAATANGTGGNGTVEYQWYSNTANSTTTPAPTILTGKTSASYTPSTEEEGTTYYFCRVTNTSSGCATTTDSKIAKIVVSEAPCFKFVAGTTKAGSGWDVANNGSITTSLWSAGDPILTGGTMTNTSGSTISAKNKSSDTHYGLVYAADGNKQVTVTLSGSHVLAEDAVITINGFSNNTTTACGFKISGNDMSPATYTPGSKDYTAFTQTYKVTAGSALEGASSFTVDQATSVRVYLKSISVTGCAECTAISPTLTAGTTTLYTYPTATSTTLTLDKNGSMGDVTWTSSDASIASVSGDGTSATVTAVGTGSATITASIATDGTHCAKSVSKTFTVTGGCGYNVIASAVLTSKTAATTSGCTLLASNMSNSSAPYKLDKTLPSYFGLQLSSGSFQVGDSIIFKVKIGDMDINEGTTYPVAVFTSTSTDDKATAIYTSGANTKGSDNVYIRFVVTSGMLTALNTNKQVLIIRNTNIKQNHSMYFAQVKRYVCPEGVFEFNDASSDGKWSTAGNWVDDGGVAESLPTISDRVIISKPVTVDDDDAVASEVILDQKSPNTGKLTIDAGNALIIAGTLKKTTTGTSVVATAAADVVINSTRAAGTGALIIGSHDGTNAATVNFETKVKYDNGYVNQYLGSPFSDETPYVDYEIQLYKFVPQGNGSHGWWNKLSYGDEMVPFMGYNQLSNNTSGNYLNLNGRTGHLNASSNVEFTIANGKMYYNSSWPENMFANSWTAPIHIDQFEDGDFTNVKKVIYIFNAGTPAQYNEAYGGENSLGNDSGDEDNEAAGTYTVIPVKSAAELSALGAITTVIPAMQAFSVMATSSSPSLTLNFNRLVYTPATTDLKIEPTRAPKRNEERPDAMRLRVRGENGWTTNAYILGREDFTNGYDDGWDGEYMEGDGSAPQLYSATEEGYFVVNCVPEIEGTLMAFHPGSADNAYTFSFVYNGSETWYLNDMKEQTSTLISNETNYPFVSVAGDNPARFVISKTPINKIVTGIDETNGEKDAKVRKLFIDDHIYIIRGGKMYTADGALVK